MKIRSVITGCMLATSTVVCAQWGINGTSVYYNAGNVGIGINNPSQALDVRGHIYTNGSVFIDGGDLVLKRTSALYGYIVRPNVPGYKKLQFAVEGGGPLEDLYVNSVQSYFAGNVGVGITASSYRLQVAGNAEIGDSHDGAAYGLLQLTRPANQPDNKFHLSFIRTGMMIAGMGFAPNSNVFGVWCSMTNQTEPMMAFTPDQRVGIGTSTPADRLTIAGGDGNIHIGNQFGGGYNGVWLNGSTNGLDYNLLSKASDPNLYINRPNGASIYFRQANIDQVVITDDGKFGVGTITPSKKLTISATEASDGIWLQGTGTTNIAFLNNTTTGNWNPLTRTGDNMIMWKGTAADAANAGGLVIGPWSASQAGIRITYDGNVGIGTYSPQAKLAVNGDVFATKIKVTQTGWSDYVFYPNYKLRPLSEVEQFINEYRHLPEVPSATEVEKEGLNIGDNQALLLKKIEELTLYVIELKKENEKQSAEIEYLKEKIKN